MLRLGFGEALQGPLPEGPARSRQDEPGNPARRKTAGDKGPAPFRDRDPIGLPVQALPEGAVLTVHRPHLPTSGQNCLGNQGPADYQDLLRGQDNGLPGPQGCQGRDQPGPAASGDYHRVHVRPGNHLLRRLEPTGPRPAGVFGPLKPDGIWPEGFGLLGQKGDILAGGQSDHLPVGGEGGDDG